MSAQTLKWRVKELLFLFYFRTIYQVLLIRQRRYWAQQYPSWMRCTWDHSVKIMFWTLTFKVRTCLPSWRISWEAMDSRGYSFLIGLGKSWTYLSWSTSMLWYAASNVGSNFRGEVDVESMPHRGLRFRLRESHRLGRRVYELWTLGHLNATELVVDE